MYRSALFFASSLLIGGSGDLAAVAELLQRITTAHTARMADLGLNA